MHWAEDQEKQLRSLWMEGYSGSLIGKALGVSRAAAIGKAWRMKLPKRRTSIMMTMGPPSKRGRPFSKTHQPKRTRRVMIEPDSYTPAPSAWEPIPGTSPIGILDLTDKTCRWPLGERPFRYCGCPVVEGSPYCAAHTAIGTKPITPKKDRGVFTMHAKGAFRRLKLPILGSDTSIFHGARAGKEVLADRADLRELSA